MKKCTSRRADYRAAANQELTWAKSAWNEYDQELRRAKIAHKHGYHVLESELKWDVRQCKVWAQMRESRAKHFMWHLNKVKPRQ